MYSSFDDLAGTQRQPALRNERMPHKTNGPTSCREFVDDVGLYPLAFTQLVEECITLSLGREAKSEDA